jgi:hypothetical protein
VHPAAQAGGFAERLMPPIREEIDLTGYRDFADAYGRLGFFLDVYHAGLIGDFIEQNPRTGGMPDPGAVTDSAIRDLFRRF